MTEKDGCGVTGCPQPGVVLVELRSFCVPHFISTAYERLDDYTRAIAEHHFHDATAETMWLFLVESIERAADLTQNAEQLDNLQRARLLDILLRSAELTRHLRRSPRKAFSIPIRLRCEKLGRAWEEETRTRVLSRYGVMIECEHSADAGDRLTLVRLDTNEEVKTRVAWRRPGYAGRFELGIEFLNCDNFWGLNWDAVEGDLGQRDWSLKTRP